MAFDPQSIQNAISSAGSQLHEMWKRGANPQMPENDLNPPSSALAFRIKLLEDRCQLLEETVGRLVRVSHGK